MKRAARSRMTRAALLEYAEDARAAYESALRRLVETPSVSADPAHRADMVRVARMAAGIVRSVGGTARVVPTGGHPLLVGELHAGAGLPTLTLYNHLDVQPADREAEGWRTEPFRFTPRKGRYYGRGTTDDKGPALAALFGVAAAHAAGVPLNIRLLWETEEEIGSTHFESTLKRLGKEVATDAVVVSDSAWLTRKKPTATAGLRGFQGFRFTLETAEADAHSGVVGGAARNPVAELMDLMSALHDARTGEVKVPGFYDGVAKLTRRERADFLGSGFTVRGFARDNRLRLLRSTQPLEVMERIWARPTFEVHGLVGGYAGPGLKAIVPARAEVKASCRLVPHQDPRKVAALVTAFARRHNPDVVVHAEGAARAARSDTDSPLADAIAAAVAFAWGKRPAFVRDGGTIGTINVMQDVLRCPVAFLDLSMPDHGYHAPNENFEWRQAALGMAAFARLAEEFAASGAKR